VTKKGLKAAADSEAAEEKQLN